MIYLIFLLFSFKFTSTNAEMNLYINNTIIGQFVKYPKFTLNYMGLEEQIKQLEDFLGKVPDPSSGSFKTYFTGMTDPDLRKFQLELSDLDLKLGGISFIGFNLGNEGEEYDGRAKEYDTRSKEPDR